MFSRSPEKCFLVTWENHLHLHLSRIAAVPISMLRVVLLVLLSSEACSHVVRVNLQGSHQRLAVTSFSQFCKAAADRLVAQHPSHDYGCTYGLRIRFGTEAPLSFVDQWGQPVRSTAALMRTSAVTAQAADRSTVAAQSGVGSNEQLEPLVLLLHGFPAEYQTAARKHCNSQ